MLFFNQSLPQHSMIAFSRESTAIVADYLRKVNLTTAKVAKVLNNTDPPKAPGRTTFQVDFYGKLHLKLSTFFAVCLTYCCHWVNSQNICPVYKKVAPC